MVSFYSRKYSDCLPSIGTKHIFAFLFPYAFSFAWNIFPNLYFQHLVHISSIFSIRLRRSSSLHICKALLSTVLNTLTKLILTKHYEEYNIIVPILQTSKLGHRKLRNLHRIWTQAVWLQSSALTHYFSLMDTCLSPVCAYLSLV